MNTINVSSPNDGLGDKLRDAFVKVNANFAELSNTISNLDFSIPAIDGLTDTLDTISANIASISNPTLTNVLTNGNVTSSSATFQAFGNSFVVNGSGLRFIDSTNETDFYFRKNSIDFNGVSGSTVLLFGTPSTNGNLTFPNENGTLATREWVSASASTPTLQDVLNEGDTATISNIILTDGTGKTAVFGGDEIRLVNVSTNETLYIHNNNFQFLGEDGNTDITFDNPTTDNQIVIPDESGTVALKEWVTSQLSTYNTSITNLQDDLAVLQLYVTELNDRITDIENSL